MNAEIPQGDSAYCGDPDDPLCGPDFGKPWCAYHGGTDDAVKQGLIEEWDVAGYKSPVPQGDSEEVFTEAPFCQIDPDNRPSPFTRRYAERDIFRIIADRIERQRVLEENEEAGLPDYETLKQSAANVEANLRDYFAQGLNKPNPRCERECTEHPAHLWDGTPVPQGKAGGVPCNCLGVSHSNDCPNWELPD